MQLPAAARYFYGLIKALAYFSHVLSLPKIALVEAI
jgi:hypothetical protein